MDGIFFVFCFIIAYNFNIMFKKIVEKSVVLLKYINIVNFLHIYVCGNDII